MTMIVISTLKSGLNQRINKILYQIKNQYDCVDNFRIANVNNQEEIKIYNKSLKKGCCGFHDEVYDIKGMQIKIGCNYGH